MDRTNDNRISHGDAHRSDAAWIVVTGLALEEVELHRFVADESCGAIVTFAGRTRRWTGQKETVRLEYDAYPSMAVAELRRIVEEAHDRWRLGKSAVHHRIGVVPVGEASVAIAVSAPHRADAFDACRYIIDELKDRVPIWKKEHFAGGDAEWV